MWIEISHFGKPCMLNLNNVSYIWLTANHLIISMQQKENVLYLDPDPKLYDLIKYYLGSRDRLFRR